MTQSEKLQALIQKAIENGFSFAVLGQVGDVYCGVDGTASWAIIKLKDIHEEIWRVPSQVLIFNHDFARALFGNGPNCAYCAAPPHNMHSSNCIEGSNIWPYLWEYQLQKAVISSSSIDYLYKAVFNDN